MKARRWRRARPHCGGWWLWQEDSSCQPARLLLSEGGTEVAADDEWECAMGRPPSEVYSENYWEMTQTTQKEMPGLWMQEKSPGREEGR